MFRAEIRPDYGRGLMVGKIVYSGSVNLSAHVNSPILLTRLHRLSRLPVRWGSCTIASIADATAPNLRALARIFLAAFTSQSTMNPQERHFKVRFSSGFILNPHIEHFTEVPFGFT
jgi:hypothetical protein